MNAEHFTIVSRQVDAEKHTCCSYSEVAVRKFGDDVQKADGKQKDKDAGQKACFMNEVYNHSVS